MKWTQTWHTRGWWELKSGRKSLADVRRCFPRQTKTGYRYKYMAVTKFGVMVGGFPGMAGPVFNTLTEAKVWAERNVR